MIVSRQNAKLKTIGRLRKCKDDKAVLEGPKLVAEAIASGIPLDAILVTPQLATRADMRRVLERAPCPIDEVEPALLASLMDADTPQGALAIASLPRRGADALPLHPDGVYLYLDGVQDPGNVGAIARAAEAAGAAGIACGPGTAHPNHPRALRGSAGSLLRLPVAVAVSADDVNERLAPVAPRWAALVAHGGEDLYDQRLAGTLVLALGAEGGGLSPATQQLAHLELRIPLAPAVESLNVATAAAVVLFELRRRGRAGAA
jgi:TrmH family RNA methyltransferase